MTKKIDILVPPLDPIQFSGGSWCVIQYAIGLAKAGYDVRIIPMLPCVYPEWIPKIEGLSFIAEEENTLKIRRRSVLLNIAKAILKRRRGKFIEAVSTFSLKFLKKFPHLLPFEFYRANVLSYIRSQAREADIVIATYFETALAARFYPAKRKLYFCQHLESLFYKELPHNDLSRVDAEVSYHLGLEVIANSSWLCGQLVNRGLQPKLCCNAINKEFFWPLSTPIHRKNNEVVLISYGGRNVDWKGFLEMARAVAIARLACPNYQIIWRVYGSASLPSKNDIANYESLGFLQQAQLGEAYRDADILLSASWYESFPLFPLEAMSCGLAVISTQLGTEDYCRHLETAYIVEPHNEQSVADGIIALVQQRELRNHIASTGLVESTKFDWLSSVERMKNIIEGFE